MDFFTQAVLSFDRLPHSASWIEAKNLFQVAASRKPEHWLIPARAYESVGGLHEQALSAILAIGYAHVGILLVDDMLDDDPRGDFHRLGMPAAANLACFFQAAALHTVSESFREPAARARALRCMNEVFLSTAFGQFLDVQSPTNESGYWHVTKTKSSPFFGAAMELGALAGGAPIEIATELKELGCLYGEMIQIHDDMHDSMEIPANPDWLQGRLPLPILFASLVAHPDQARFLNLRKQVQLPRALEEAQEILIRCGSISYCADQLIQRHQKAMKTMNRIPLMNREPISTLFDEIIAPVDNLLKAVE